MELFIKAYISNFRPMLTGASLAQDRGRMEARIEALTAEVSGLKKECQVNSLTAYVIGHFGVRKSLAFRTRLSSKPFLRQWVYLHANKNFIYILMTSHRASLGNWGFGQIGNGLLRWGTLLSFFRSYTSTETQARFIKVPQRRNLLLLPLDR